MQDTPQVYPDCCGNQHRVLYAKLLIGRNVFQVAISGAKTAPIDSVVAEKIFGLGGVPGGLSLFTQRGGCDCTRGIDVYAVKEDYLQAETNQP